MTTDDANRCASAVPVLVGVHDLGCSGLLRLGNVAFRGMTVEPVGDLLLSSQDYLLRGQECVEGVPLAYVSHERAWAN